MPDLATPIPLFDTPPLCQIFGGTIQAAELPTTLKLIPDIYHIFGGTLEAAELTIVYPFFLFL